MKSSGEQYKKIRAEQGDDAKLYTMPEQKPLPDFKKLIAEANTTSDSSDANTKTE